MPLTRRQFMIATAGLSVAAKAFPLVGAARAADGFFDLTAGVSPHPLYPGGKSSELWTYNGMNPGPEIRVRRGETVRVRLKNTLEEPTSVHWHGIRIANAMDGVSGLTQEAVPPGETFDYEFTVPDAGTFWYHAHNKSWNQVPRGLYGPLIVEEDTPTFDADHELTLLIVDWRLTEDGQFDVASLGQLMDWTHGGRLGNWPTVNGESGPRFSLIAGDAYRLRLINAANARVFQFDPSAIGAKVLAFDGQSLAAPLDPAGKPVALGPGQRMDLLVVPETGANFALNEMTGGGPGFPVAGFMVTDPTAPAPAYALPAPNALPQPDLANARQVTLRMTGGAMGRMDDIVYQGKPLATRDDFLTTRQFWAMNGIANLADDPLFSAKAGETIALDVVNETAFPHAMHTHGHHFQIIEQQGGDPAGPGAWRDTFLIQPDETTRIAFVADNRGKWLLHCHMLEHAAAGMNTWFEVT